MSNNEINKGKLIESALTIIASLAPIVVKALDTSKCYEDARRDHEFTNSLYTDLFVTNSKDAKDLALTKAKIQKARMANSEYSKAVYVGEAAEFVSDKSEFVQRYAITELTKIASESKDSYWRSRMFDHISDI